MLMGYVYDRAADRSELAILDAADAAGRREHQAAAPSPRRIPRELGADARGVTHDDVVSEIAAPVDRVVVVGAGIAGLAAASWLCGAGITCVVLEARDRIGGRLHTVELAGTPVDLGGSWIHHPVGNPLSAACDQLGVARDPGDPIPSLSAYDRAERRRLDRAEVETLAGWNPRRSGMRVAALSDRLGPDATAADAIDAHVAERGLTGSVARRVRQELRAEVEADAADLAGNQSLRWLAIDEQFEGDLSAICRATAIARWFRRFRQVSTFG